MKYYVYTDGASSNIKECVACSYVIFTDDKYIGSGMKKIKKITNPGWAETIALGIAATYLMDNVELNEDDEVEFYVDCASVLEFIPPYMGNNDKIYLPNNYLYSTIVVLRKLYSMVKMSLNKVRGHKGRLNPNSYVDRLAKLILRR